LQETGVLTAPLAFLRRRAAHLDILGGRRLRLENQEEMRERQTAVPRQSLLSARKTIEEHPPYTVSRIYDPHLGEAPHSLLQEQYILSGESEREQASLQVKPVSAAPPQNHIDLDAIYRHIERRFSEIFYCSREGF
jgi:hypothetical protein